MFFVKWRENLIDCESMITPNEACVFSPSPKSCLYTIFFSWKFSHCKKDESFFIFLNFFYFFFVLYYWFFDLLSLNRNNVWIICYSQKKIKKAWKGVLHAWVRIVTENWEISILKQYLYFLIKYFKTFYNLI